MQKNSRITSAKQLAMASAILAVLVPLVAGFYYPGYSHVRDYISELGAAGSPTGVWVSYLGFLPIGILVIAFVFVARPLIAQSKLAVIGFYMLWGIGIAYAGAAFAPCDLHCPAEGSIRQTVHNSLGLLEYLGGGIGLILFALGNFKQPYPMARRLLLGLGVVTLLGMVLMVAPPNAGHAGLNQRIAEAALFSSLLIIAWQFGDKKSKGSE